ncbi:MAG: Coenzyme F420 hydrogenase/dehydrogenase, beta subunit C-terminal domain, partial [Planctomycetes bacterium]|nr:Coenzyme F420 hydrogenase/dehydrogenase, beta subunit C-terminal domain [Planctomycetota bacterium]
TGEFADIAVGDPWHRVPDGGDPGRSLILIRSERGRELFHCCLEAGYLNCQPAAPAILSASQPNLLKSRGHVFMRRLVASCLGAAAPRYENLPLFGSWVRELTLMEKLRSIGGSIKRVFKKGLRRPLDQDDGSP